MSPEHLGHHQSTKMASLVGETKASSTTPNKMTSLAGETKAASIGSTTPEEVWAEDGWWTKWNGPQPDLTVDEKVALAMEVARGGEITKDEQELRELYARKPNPVAYDGFEPSGRMHIAQGLLRSMNVNRLTGSGVKFVFWVADYFALMNLKLGGDIVKIQNCGRYLIEVWKACGMDMTNVEFVWASEFINRFPEKYWFNVMQIAMRNNISRIKRCGMAMGREASDNLATSQLFYPCMQCNDVFQLRCDITSLGMDQRKVNMLAREYCSQPDDTGLLKYLGKNPKTKRTNKPVILSHHMLAGLTGVKMSKSDPDSAIFMEDTVKDVVRKIKKAWCPPGVLVEKRMVEKPNEKNEDGTPKMEEIEYTNGCMEYLKYIVFPKVGSFTVTRTDENGGNKTYDDYASLEVDFLSQALWPGDLKTALSTALNGLLDNVRAHFTNDPVAKDLLNKMKQYMAERAAAKNGGKKKKQQKQKGGKGGKGGKKGGAPKGPPAVYDLEDPAVVSCLDIRVGEISNTRLHPDADTLYIEDVNVGEEGGPRTVVSGLVNYLSVEQVSGPCIVVCNMKARKMKGVASQAMVLAAVSADGTSVELLRPPLGAKVGAKVTFEDTSGFGGFATPKQLNGGKGKAALAGILADAAFATNANKVASFRGNPMVVAVAEGSDPLPVTVASLTASKIK